jgi:hypothetical protein
LTSPEEFGERKVVSQPSRNNAQSIRLSAAVIPDTKQSHTPVPRPSGKAVPKSCHAGCRER